MIKSALEGKSRTRTLGNVLDASIRSGRGCSSFIVELISDRLSPRVLGKLLNKSMLVYHVRLFHPRPTRGLNLVALKACTVALDNSGMKKLKPSSRLMLRWKATGRTLAIQVPLGVK